VSAPAGQPEVHADYAPGSGQPAWGRSPRETEAVRLAEQALSRVPEPRPVEPLGVPAPSAEEDSGAVRLPDGIRDDLEPRFGVDLGDVRVQTDSEIAERTGAQAFARGRVVAFAPGAWSPGTAAGRQLLAHELAHVVLERGMPAAMASQRPPGKPLFYQDVLDADHASQGRYERAIRPVLDLCEVVDQERTAEIDQAVKALGQVDVSILPLDLPSAKTSGELMARMVLLGAAPLVPRLHAWLSALPGVIPANTPGRRHHYDYEVQYWAGALRALRTHVGWSSAGGAATSLDGYLAFIPVLVKVRDALPASEVKEDADRIAASGDPPPSFGMQSGPTISISRYQARLAELTGQAFADAMAAVQAMIDLATAGLESGQGTALLDATAARLGQLRALPVPPEADIQIDETVWEQVKGKRAGVERLVQIDAFRDQPGAAARRTVLTGYDVTMPYARPERSVTPQRLLDIRMEQVQALRRIYGAEQAAGQPTPEAVENQAALAKRAASLPSGTTALHLHSDDDWRAFLLEKFRLHAATSSPAAAFDSLVNLLGVYLRAFTTHSPMNIDDFGDNQLTQNFPRALTGQLVHDCGVYALRIAYMLSLVRTEPALRLDFRWVQLPVHIGLIITSSTAPIGAYLAHNDNVTRYEQDQLDVWRATWDVTGEKGQPRPAARHTKKTDDEFLGELAADALIPLTDVPYLISDVPRLTGAAVADKAALWAAYQKNLKHKLFGKVTEDPDSPQYQFHLRYLDLLEQAKHHYNTFLVPFWNLVGHPAWLAARDALMKTDAQRSAATTAAGKQSADASFRAAVSTYLDGKPGTATMSLIEAFGKTRDAFQAVLTAREQVTQDLQAHPEVAGPGISRASTARLLEVFNPFLAPWWSRDVEQHINDLRGGLLTQPPYAEDKQQLLPPAD
jgi:hypothetical protein